MDGLSSLLGLPESDFLVVADGSGTVSNKPCGWAVYVYDVAAKRLSFYAGGTTGGTNNYAELEPIVYGLSRIEGEQGNLRWGKRVAVISDSEVTIRCGQGRYERRANRPLWASVEWFERDGWFIHWHHVARNSNVFNASCDKTAGSVRRTLATMVEQGTLDGIDGFGPERNKATTAAERQT